MYFDGVLKPGKDIQAVQTLNTSPNPMAIGVLPDPRVYYFNGIIDEVAIFTEELSANDIKGISKGGILNALSVSSTSKLAISWGRIKM